MLLLAATLAAPDAAACGRLQGLSLAETTILSTEVLSGKFTPPVTNAATTPRPIPVPAACRVVGRIQPAIAFEVWLPLTTGTASSSASATASGPGQLSYSQLGDAAQARLRGRHHRHRAYRQRADRRVSRSGTPKSWCRFRPPRGPRDDRARQGDLDGVLRQAHGRHPSSVLDRREAGTDGGQRYPADYDVIVAGSPANYWTHLSDAELCGGGTCDAQGFRVGAPHSARVKFAYDEPAR